MQRFIIYILFIFITFFFACSRKPSSVIPEDKMMDILYDLRLADAIYSNDSSLDSYEKRDAIVAGILAKYGITQVQLDASLAWYSDNMGEYRVINDSVAERLRAQSNLLATQRTEIESKLVQTTNHILPRLAHLDEYTSSFFFNIDSLLIKSVDLPTFHLSFNITGINKFDDVETGLFFRYKDTVANQFVQIQSNGEYNFSKPQLPDSLLKSVSGYVHLRNKVKGTPANIYIYNISYTDSLSTNTGTISNDHTNHPVPKTIGDKTQELVPIEDIPVMSEKDSKKLDAVVNRKREK